MTEGFIRIKKGCDNVMKTKMQQELVDSFLDVLDHEFGSLYREIVYSRTARTADAFFAPMEKELHIMKPLFLKEKQNPAAVQKL